MLLRPNQSERSASPKTGARLSVLVFLTAVVAGISLLVTGLLLREIRLVSAGVLALVITAFARSWFPGIEWTIATNREQSAGSGLVTEELQAARIAELVQLLRRWEGLEHERGMPGFDPSAVQAVRHDIREIVHADPTLDGLFRGSPRAA